MILPKSDRISWPDYFMLEALIAAQRSPDPNTSVGAVLIDKNKHIIATGYNGLPKGININNIDWSRDNPKPEDTKYPYIIHAEVNCILNCNCDTNKTVMYCTLHPCNECTKVIIQSGIKKVVYLKNPYYDTWQVKVADKMFKMADIITYEYKWDKDPKEYLNSLICAF